MPPRNKDLRKKRFPSNKVRELRVKNLHLWYKEFVRQLNKSRADKYISEFN